MRNELQSILELLTLSERLKFELRHSWLSNGRQESVAEHSWQMALFAMILHRELEYPVDLAKTLKMILIHDLVEAEAGDIPFFENSSRQEEKADREQVAIERIREILPEMAGEEIYQLWYEFEERFTPEAKFAKALDNLEVQIQHNRASLDTWEEVEYELVYSKMDQYCEHDACLRALCELVKSEAEEKMREAGVDCEEVKRRVAQNIP